MSCATGNGNQIEDDRRIAVSGYSKDNRINKRYKEIAIE
jgi:hypothetical protein